MARFIFHAHVPPQLRGFTAGVCGGSMPRGHYSMGEAVAFETRVSLLEPTLRGTLIQLAMCGSVRFNYCVKPGWIQTLRRFLGIEFRRKWKSAMLQYAELINSYLQLA